MNTETENKAVVERYAAAVAAGDAQTARELFAPDGDLDAGRRRPADRGDLGGTRHDHRRVPRRRAVLLRARLDHASRSPAWSRRTTRSSCSGRAAHGRARGRSYENGCIGVFTVADGQIQHVREYMDTLYARDVAFDDGGDYVQPSTADTSTAVSSIRSTAGGRL